MASTLLWVLWRYAVHAHLVRPDMADEEVELLTQRLTPGLGGYVLLIVLGLFVPVIAVAGYLAIALYYIIPFRRWTRLDPFGHLRRGGRGGGTGQPGRKRPGSHVQALAGARPRRGHRPARPGPASATHR